MSVSSAVLKEICDVSVIFLCLCAHAPSNRRGYSSSQDRLKVRVKCRDVIFFNKLVSNALCFHLPFSLAKVSPISNIP